MVKKRRYIYEIELSSIVDWDEESHYPKVMNPLEVDEYHLPYSTARILDAFEFYDIQEDKVSDNQFLELNAREIEVTDEEWNCLMKMDRLKYSDYCNYITEEGLRTLAWKLLYESHFDSNDSLALDELLIVQSENFNMRVICNKAGMSYSTYRGFKNNKQPFSVAKKIKLLKCMNEVGNMCWDKNIEKKYWNYVR